MSFKRKVLRALVASALAIAVAPAHGQSNLTDLDLATLMTMDVTVTTAAKRAQSSSSAAAAVYVITREGIRRSGATSVPELLRYAPGLQVARISTRAWSVTARGFGTRFANKLLVLIDGRSIYNALFSGVMWEEQPIPLENIERIEVVRGPGGALWGMNAVNGVINIITRHSADEPGLYMHGDAGSRETGGALSYAAERAALGALRLYAAHADIDSYDDEHETPLARTQVGARLDRDALGGNLLFSTDYSDSDFSAYDGMRDSSYPRYAKTGSALLGWTRGWQAGDLELRGFYESIDRSDPGAWNEHTAGLEAQFNAARRGSHLWSLGVGLRRVIDEQQGLIPSLRLAERGSEQNQWSVFAQDEIFLADDAVRLTAGVKLEDFDLGGLAFQPTLRALWQFNDAHTFWAAASHALRAPSRFERGSNVETLIADSPPTYYILVGDDDLVEEQLNAYELGWRWRAAATLSFDLAAYHNSYSNLIGVNELAPQIDFGPPLRVYAPRLYYANRSDARTEGVELTTQWQVTHRLRLQASGAYSQVHADDEVLYLTSGGRRVDPETSLSVQARMDLRANVKLDLAWRYVDTLPAWRIPAYETMDVRTAWNMTPALELSFSIENALGGAHQEFFDELKGGPGVTLERTYLVRAVWRPAHQ